MKKRYLLSLLLVLSTSLSFADPTVVWTAVFSDAQPINAKTNMAFCEAHTPTVMVTTIEQITSHKGVDALNGVNVRYLSYKTVVKDHLYFNIVNARISGKDNNGKPWSEPMKLYEQTLSSAGKTWTVWSTPYCKGTFIGTPTIKQ